MNIKDFHIAHNYYVRVENLLNTLGCKVSYPANILTKTEPETCTYLLADGYMEVYYNNKLHTIDAPNYSQRVLVVADIVLHTIHKDISSELIFLFKDGECLYNTSIFSLLNVNFTEQELQYEKELTTVFQNIVCGIKPKTDPHTKEGYDLVIRCFERGGLL